MNEDQVLEILQKVGAFRAGHFILTSGRHGDTYINKDALYPYTRDTSELCKEIARRFKGRGVEAIIGPAVGAAILSQWTAYHLSDMEQRTVFATYADKDGEGGFVIRRGYDQLINDKKIIVVEDLTTTGGSIKKVVDAAKRVGAHIVGAGVLCNRGDVTPEMVNVPILESLVSVGLDSWEQSECDLCKRGIPINTEVGHGSKKK